MIRSGGPGAFGTLSAESVVGVGHGGRAGAPAGEGAAAVAFVGEDSE